MRLSYLNVIINLFFSTTNDNYIELLFTVTCPFIKGAVLIFLQGVLSRGDCSAVPGELLFPISRPTDGWTLKGSEWKAFITRGSPVGHLGYCSSHLPTTYRDNTASYLLFTNNFHVKILSLFFQLVTSSFLSFFIFTQLPPKDLDSSTKEVCAGKGESHRA